MGSAPAPGVGPGEVAISYSDRFTPPVEVDVAGRIRELARIRCYADGPREVAASLRASALDRAP